MSHDSVFAVPLNGTRQYCPFDIGTALAAFFGVLPVRDSGDVLLDDRAFVEVGGRVVRCSADQLDSARLGLRVRICTDECGQERVGTISLTETGWGEIF